MLALAVKAAHAFFEDQPPPRWQWWTLEVIPADYDKPAYLLVGERCTFMLGEAA